MICHELERATKSMLHALTLGLSDGAGGTIGDGSGGFLSAGVDGRGLVNNRNDGSELPLPDSYAIRLNEYTVLNFYTSEHDGDIVVPCVIVVSQGGTDDVLTGNETVELEVQVQFSADNSEIDEDSKTKIARISEAIADALLRDDLIDELNVYASAIFTAIGVVERSTSRTIEGRTWLHTRRLSIYCAGCDLVGAVSQPI